MKIGILGCGNWGSVFGIVQHQNGHSIKIWEYDKVRAQYLRKTRDNKPFLLRYKIPEEILVDWDIESVMHDADLIVFAIPSQVLSKVVEAIKGIRARSGYYLSLVKGIDIRTLQRPSEIIARLPQTKGRIFVLSGPCIANEIIHHEPTAVVVVGQDHVRTIDLQRQLATDYFRIYQGADMVGVELGAAIKNVLAIACGMSDGLGFGYNAKGALVTRGIVEMQRLGVAMGAQANTFYGLSGFGDLVTTSCSEESRNHMLGMKIGKGKGVKQALREMVMVAEGMPTAYAVRKLAARYQVDMPICKVVYEILFKNKSPKTGIRDLMMRPLKTE